MAQLAVGSIITASVTQVDVWGFYLHYDDATILVLAPEVSWTGAVSDCRDFTSVGQAICVKVLRFVEPEAIYLGSVKQAHPEEDPWRDISYVSAGQLVPGRVHRIIHGESPKVAAGYLIDLGRHLTGVLLSANCTKAHDIGDTVIVSAQTIDISRRQIDLVEHPAKG